MQLLPLSTLPSDNIAYHVDCVGYLWPNPYCTFNPILDVRLSPVDDKNLNNATQNVYDQFDKSKQKKFQISIGEMYAIHSGCVLKNGKVIRTPNQPNFHAKIDVSSKSVKSIFASKLDSVPIVGDSKYIIPNDRWGFGTLGMSQLVAVERDGDPYSILIPAIELLRFYHCSSSRLNQILISGQVKYFDQYIETQKDKTYFDLDTKTLHLTMKRAFPKEDALIVGRWFCDKYAHDAAMAPWNQRMMLVNHPNANYIPLTSTFPFRGETTLHGIAVNLPTPDHIKTQRVLLVSLTYCSRGFPFDHLILKQPQYEKEDTDESNEEDNPEELQKKYRKPLPPDSTEEDAENDPFANSSGFWDTTNIRIPSSRFPAVKITHEQCEIEHTSPHTCLLTDDTVPSGQTTSVTSSGDATQAPINLIPAEKKDENQDEPEDEISAAATFDGFIAICNSIQQQPEVYSVSSEPLFEKQRISDHIISEFPDSVSDFGQSWIKMGTKKTSRNRQFMLKQVHSEYGYHYLLHIERKRDSAAPEAEFDELFAIYIFSGLSREVVQNAKLDALLRDLSEVKFRLYKSIFTESDFLITTKRHTATAGNMAIDICKKLSKLS